ncbi:MAG: YidC/Oxa1 family membrane protein insertase [Candidatus Wildermuthbacteria bacterium]|nr:YidC/Oxa1 family membrane protein insertase [Candidatus Wildermuthbacteria bacterium]
MFSSLYHTFLFDPFFNILVILYNLIPGKDFGLAIILLTLLFRFALYPLSAKAIVAQRKIADIQPKAKEIQERFKGDKDRQARELLALYAQEKVNPFAGILPLLIQLPFLITLYQVFWNGLDAEQLSRLYGFVQNPAHIDPVFLGFLDLGGRSFALALAAAVFQFFQGKQMAGAKKETGPAPTAQKYMLYLFPAITLMFVSQLPSAIGLYWVTTTLFSIGQQWMVTRKRQTP